MILNRISDIKKIRKKLGLTQKELAEKSGVSQSLIAKIESGATEPTYSKAVKLIETLELEQSKNQLNAGEIMTKRVIKCSPKDKVKRIVEIMQKEKISQMPVFEEHKCVGIISESSILEAKLKGEVKTVDECMDETPPIVNKNANIKMISEMLEYSQIILVADKGSIVGVITKSDVIRGI